MYLRKISFGLICAVLLGVAPHMTLAYFTVGQSAETMTPQTGFYTVSYEFGRVKEDVYLPILAVRGNTATGSKAIGYSVRSNDGAIITNGTTAALVVANLPIENGMYKIAKGKAEKMTLIVFYSKAQNTPSASYHVQVDLLPFFVDYGNGSLVQQGLNPSELQYYKTPAQAF